MIHSRKLAPISNITNTGQEKSLALTPSEALLAKRMLAAAMTLRALPRDQLVAAQNQALALTLDLEREKLAARASLIAAEIGGQSWMQRNWRPITMLSFLTLVILDSFGLLVFRLSDEAWLLLQIGLGGYVVGRSAEKMLPAIRVGGHKGHAGQGGQGAHHD